MPLALTTLYQYILLDTDFIKHDYFGSVKIQDRKLQFKNTKTSKLFSVKNKKQETCECNMSHILYYIHILVLSR